MRKDRIEARMDALGINQFEAAEKAGKNSHYIYDFMVGRKSSFKGDGPVRVAQALECSIEYLTGESDEIGVPPMATPAAVPSAQAGRSLPLAGVVETGVFRRPSSVRGAGRPLPIAPFPDYPAEAQAAFAVRGGGMDTRGIIEGMTLVAVDIEAATKDLESGSVVIVEHVRSNGREAEISARELQYFPDRIELRAQSRSENIRPLILRDGKIVGEGGKIRITALVIGAILRL